MGINYMEQIEYEMGNNNLMKIENKKKEKLIHV